MRSILLSFSLIFLLISCAAPEDKTQIRFVNLQGKPRNIAMRYPEKNVDALHKKMPAENISFDESVDRSINKMVVARNEGPTFQESQMAAESSSPATYNLPTQNAGVENVAPKDEKNAEVVEYDLSQGSAPAPVEAAENKSGKIIIHEVLAPENEPENAPKAKVDKKSFKLANGVKRDSKALLEVEESGKSGGKSTGKYFVQVGAFSNGSNASNLLEKMEKFHSGSIKKLSANNKTVYRVWLGPLKNKDEASKLAKKVGTKNQAAIVVKDK